MNHAQARAIVRQAMRSKFGREPNLTECQCVQAIGWLETQYGAGWHGAGSGSHNWGAVQTRESDPAKAFLYTDTHPNPDGTSTRYQVHFARYADDLAGCLGMLAYCMRTRDEQDTAHAGLIYGYSAEMYEAHYYEGFGATKAIRIANHHKAVANAIKLMARELVEPLPDLSIPGIPDEHYLGMPATIKRFSTGDAVRMWQRVIGAVADGMFGPATETRTRAWQAAHGLAPDGIVGPHTWDVADGVLDGKFKEAA